MDHENIHPGHHKSRLNSQIIAITTTGILLGFLVILQSRSFRGVQDIIGRDTRANVFREIQILKTTNENLTAEIKDLEDQLSKASDRQQALNAVQDEIKKDRILAGHVDVEGPGIQVTVSKPVAVIWLTDIVNEMWSAGAEAVSVNNIRLTNSTVGFDLLPNGQVALNGVPLTAPYDIEAIGDGKTLNEALNQTQGVLERLRQSVQGVDLTNTLKEKIGMGKVI